MGQPKTKTVGGGSATPTADAFQKFLQSQMGGGEGGTQSPFQQGFQNLMSGTTDPTKYQTQGMANLPSAPGFAGTNFSPLNTNLSLNQAPSFAQIMAQAGGAGSRLAGFNANAGGNQGSLQDIMGSGRINYNMDAINMANPDVLSQRAQTMKAVLDRQNALNLADTRQRFAAGGMGSMGSGASLAEAQQTAEGQNRLLMGLQGVTQQDIQNQLQFGQLNSQNRLASMGLQQGDILGRLGLANTQQLGNYQIGNQASIANMQGNLQAALGQGQLGMQGIGLGLQGAGMQAANALNAANFNQLGLQQNNMNRFNQNAMLNQFMNQQYGMRMQGALQNQAMGNQFGLGAATLGQQGMMDMMNQLFGGFGQATGKGIAQAQTVQVPNDWQAAIGGINDVLGVAGGIKNLANPFSSSPTRNPSISGSPGIQTGMMQNPQLLQMLQDPQTIQMLMQMMG